MKHTTPSRDKGKPSDSVLAINTDNTQTSTKLFINLVLTTHTLEAIQHILTATPASRLCTTTHISHPTLPLTMTQLHNLNSLIQSIQDQTLSQRIIFHHIHITAMSILTLSDRTLKITLDTTIHILTPARTRSVIIPHYLHLYLNPHDRLPYLQHTCTGIEPKSYRLIVTTSLPCHQYGSSNVRRRPMLRTTAHAPDLVTTLTFPAKSIQHQQSILILATHLLLTVPIITPQQSWSIIREKKSHRHTLQLILDTITLKRYHLIWHTVMNPSPEIQLTQQQPTEHLSTRSTRRITLPPRHRHPKRRRHTRS